MAKQFISTTSGNLDPTNKSWVSVVYQTGKPVLDRELNLVQNISQQRSSKPLPSGIISESPVSEGGENFVYYDISDPNFQANTIWINPFTVNVAGYEIYVGGSTANGLNKIQLPAPSSPLGVAPDIKRTDFVFLEVWQALVTPASEARGNFRILDNTAIIAGQIFTLDGTAIGGATINLVAGTDFDIGATAYETARNLSDEINLISTLGVNVSAETRGTEFAHLTFDGGANGNQIVLSTTSAGASTTNPVGGTNGEGIPAPNKIYFAGNTQSDSSLDHTDDIRDGVIGETTRRVQMQYRFRVYSADFHYSNGGTGSDPKTQPDGFSNQNIFAQGGQSAPVASQYFSPANGNEYVVNTLKNYHPLDAGLYIAGDGTQSSATAFNTVDGYVYAIPVCFVFRRNEGQFDPELQANNALLHNHASLTNANLDTNATITIGVGESDRPDGLFSDVIVASDILDIRKRVFPRGVDYSAELDRQFGFLLDNQLKTWFMDSSDFRTIASGSGSLSVSPMVCDEIGRSATLVPAGKGGTTNRGNFIRNFDHVCSRFSDVPTVARLVLEIYPDGTNNHQGAISVSKAAGTKWYQGDEIEIDISSLDGSGSFKVWDDTLGIGKNLHLDDLFPTGTQITDVLECWHDEGNYTASVSQEAHFSFVEGLGTSTISLTLDYNSTAVDGGQNNVVDYQMVGDATNGDVGSPRRIFVTLLVEYPAGEGLSATPISNQATPTSGSYPTGSVIEYDSNQRASDSVAQSPLIYFREGVREVSLERITTSITDTLVSSSDTTIKLPWKVHADDSTNYDPVILDTTNGNANVVVNLASSSLGSSNSQLTFTAPFAGQRLLQVQSYARAPIPTSGVNGYQVAVYYQARANQTFGARNNPASLPIRISVKPIKVSEKMWSIQAGSSTSEESYPYGSPSVQLGVHPSIAGYTSEADLQGSTQITLEDISINSGLIALPTVLPMDSTGMIVFDSPDTDGERRAVYKGVYDNRPQSPFYYQPNAYSQRLDESVLHKNALPFIARIEDENAYPHFRKGEIVLGVLCGLSTKPEEEGISSRSNMVRFSSTEQRTVVCFYKPKDLILSGV